MLRTDSGVAGVASNLPANIGHLVVNLVSADLSFSTSINPSTNHPTTIPHPLNIVSNRVKGYVAQLTLVSADSILIMITGSGKTKEREPHGVGGRIHHVVCVATFKKDGIHSTVRLS